MKTYPFDDCAWPRIGGPIVGGGASGTANITGGKIMGGALVGASAQILSKSGIPFIKPPSGTMGNNGAFVLGTALPRTIANGYMWFDANQIAAGVAAGWYWFDGTDTTHVTVRNSTYVSGTPVAGADTAFSTTGPGAITASIVEIFGPTITLPGGLLGANGKVKLYSQWSANNGANAKIPTLRFSGNAGTAYFTEGSFVSLSNIEGYANISNNGAANKQVGGGLVVRFSSVGLGAIVTSSVDTSANTSLVLTLKTATAATDYLILETFEFTVLTDGT